MALPALAACIVEPALSLVDTYYVGKAVTTGLNFPLLFDDKLHRNDRLARCRRFESCLLRHEQIYCVLNSVNLINMACHPIGGSRAYNHQQSPFFEQFIILFI